MSNRQKQLKPGDRVRLTGIGNISLLGHLDSEEINQMDFPIETEVFYQTGNPTALCIGSQKWAVDWFTYEIIEPAPAHISPTMLYCELPQLMAMCAATDTTPYKNNFGGMQAGFSLTNGKTWLIVVAMPPLNVAIHDGEVNAIIHDQIPTK